MVTLWGNLRDNRQWPNVMCCKKEKGERSKKERLRMRHGERERAPRQRERGTIEPVT